MRVRLPRWKLKQIRKRLKRCPPVVHFGVGWYSPVPARYVEACDD